MMQNIEKVTALVWVTIGGINIFGENIKLPLEHIELLDTMLKDGLKK